MVERLRRYLVGRQDEMLRLLERLVNIDSGSYCKAGIDACGRILAAELSALGFQTEILPETDRGSHVRAIRPGNAGPEVFLSGHLDTVWPEGIAAQRPLRNDGRFLWGPGVGDMKGGLVLMLYALKALQAEGVRTGPLSVFLCGDEELGSVRGRPHIEELARRSSCVLVVEGSVPPSTAVIRRWGVGAFRLQVQGRAAHVLDAQGGGVNACRELALKVLALEDLSDAAAGVRVSVNVVQGGSARLVTAGEARAEVDVRVRDAAAVSALEQAVRRTAETPVLRGASCTLSGQMTRPPMQPNERTEALLTLAEEVGAEIGSPVAAGEKAGGSDGSFAAALGVATLDGMGPLGYDMCGEQERIELDCLVPRSLMLARLLQRLGEKPRSARRS